MKHWQEQFFTQMLNLSGTMVEDSVNKASVRTITTTVADPRICVGDVIYADIPGHIQQKDINDSVISLSNPNSGGGTYITQLSRSMDLTVGTYTASYSGYRYKVSEAQLKIGRDKENYWGYALDRNGKPSGKM